MILVVLLMTLAAGLLWAVGVAAVRDEMRAPVPPPLRVPARRPIRTEVPHLLYFYRSTTGPRIYWGISNDPDARHARHLTDPKDQWWMSRSSKVMYYDHWYPNRTTALAAERRAIRASAYSGEPIANQVHHPAGRIRRAIH